METNHSAVLLDLAKSLQQKALETEQRLRDVYRAAQESGKHEIRQLTEELRKKAKEIWKASEEAYVRLKKEEEERHKKEEHRQKKGAGQKKEGHRQKKDDESTIQKELHLGLGCVLLVMERWDAAFKEFETIGPASGNGPWREAVVLGALSYVTSAESYYLTKEWLTRQQDKCRESQDLPGWRDAQAATLLLVSKKLQTAGQSDSVQPERVAARDIPLHVTPIIVEADPTLDPSQKDWYQSPLFLEYMPAMKQRVKGMTGVDVPEPSFRGVPISNSYAILINEMPVAEGTVERGRRFCPSYSEATLIVKSGEPLRRAFNPLTGEDGAWIEQGSWEDFQFSDVQLWECLEYVVYHLEMVVRANLSSFLGVQEVQRLLDTSVEESKADEAKRHELIKKALPDSPAKVRFTQVLQGLVKEGAPIVNLSAILESFQQNAIDTDVIELIEAARQAIQAIKDDLPGNDESYELLPLSASLEEEVNRWIQELDGKIFFALPRRVIQSLLAAIRSTIEQRQQSKLAILTNKQGIRPFVLRLIEHEFPQVPVLSVQELGNEQRARKSGVIIEYASNEKEP
jgi:flagellar biosynthesis component FlhA